MCNILGQIKTKYGLISGIINEYFYENGQLQECMLEEKNELKLLNNVLVPKYSTDEVRDKYTHSLSFYPSGQLQSIAIEEQTDVETPLGIIPAELITFHENGPIDRIFMLNGKLSAYWTEDDEYKLAIPITIRCRFAEITKKFISFCFYPGNQLKSVTLWKKEIVPIQTVNEVVNTRIGFSLYEDGSIETLEPNLPAKVVTPIGSIEAYDANAIGIFGDCNSLKFHQDGKIASLVTSTNQISVVDKQQQEHVFTPKLVPSSIVIGSMVIAPITVAFQGEQVIFYDFAKKEYKYFLYDIQCVIENVKEY